METLREDFTRFADERVKMQNWLDTRAKRHNPEEKKLMHLASLGHG